MVNCDYLYDKEYFSKSIEKNYFVEKKLSYSSYDNAYIVPLRGNDTGVYTDGGGVIHAPYISLNGDTPGTLNFDEMPSDCYHEETVIYLGVIWSCWGHILTDIIGAFWFLMSKYYIENFKDCKYVFIPQPDIADKGIPKNARKLFEILGFDETKLVMPKEIVQYKKVIVPDICFFGIDNFWDRYFTAEYRELVQKVRLYQQNHFMPDKSCEKMYFSYKSYNKGKSVGEEKLESFFKSQGYKIVYPEKHTLDEQLNMLANCRFFASTIGSCSHNAIFLPEHTNAILIPRAWYLTGHQVALNQVIDLNVYFVDSSLSLLAGGKIPIRGPFFYYVSEELMSFFGIDKPCDKRYYKKQLVDLKKYLRKANLMEDLEERYMPEYYNRQFMYCMGKLHEEHPWRNLFWKVWAYAPGMVKNTLRGLTKNMKGVNNGSSNK